MEKGWEWREQREGPDVRSMGHVLGIRKGPVWQDCMGIRLLRLSGQFMRGLECQDEEFNLVLEVPGSFSRLWNREGPWYHSSSVGRTDCDG